MIEKIQKTREYLNYLEEHYNNVQKAWKLLYEQCGDLFSDDWIYASINSEVMAHDESKLSANEFVQYVNWFHSPYGSKYDIWDDGGRGEDIHLQMKKEFESAWEHHKKHNPHHWQNWTTRNFGRPNEQWMHFIHNLIDWIAMGFKFGDTAIDYYEKNKADIQLPDWAEKQVYEILERVYQ